MAVTSPESASLTAKFNGINFWLVAQDVLNTAWSRERVKSPCDVREEAAMFLADKSEKELITRRRLMSYISLSIALAFAIMVLPDTVDSGSPHHSQHSKPEEVDSGSPFDSEHSKP